MGALDLFGQVMTQAVLPAAGTVLSGLAVNYVRKLTKKANIEISQQQEMTIRRLVMDGLKMVEEQARRDPSMTSEQKRAAAVKYLIELGPQLGGTVTTAQAERMIDAGLPDLRAEQALTEQGAPIEELP